MPTKPNLVIIGRRWFQRTYGNTYHSVSITLANGETINSGKHYGYGEQYMQTAYAMLRERVPELPERGCITIELNKRFNLVYQVMDVARERDL